ncbi:NAD(P)H-binding protein [Massilia sp. CCM 8733]|uniref:NAD(P)H-binding protein n=1 Tax=Massilia mucilaginosa TaxID=2609282 RepID=A0ABX0NU96_9BURK|nr:NAD(P)-dependent oxidoreductase [Massilia mucilaginosa]NHZ90319.1 NAD(P)H-binding protein [Massilia mucilaginosa]
MNIVLIGATGFIGTALLNEALNRGHAVTALATRPEKLAARERLQAHKTDVMEVAALTAQLAGADAVLSAFSGHAQGDVQAYYLAGVRNIIAAVKEARAPRLLVVGGAGSLDVAPGVQLLDTPGFPEAYRASAEGARQALNLLRAEASLDWTMLSPAAMISPGQRSGVFRLGGDQLLADAAGNSAISVEDYAVAMIDELEQPTHSRQRFTVAY